MDIFDYVKQNISLRDVVEGILGESCEYGKCYTNCPFCDHKGHFAIKQDGSTEFYKCFNGCKGEGTIVDFYINYYNLSSTHEAIAKIKKDYNLETMYNNFKKEFKIKSKKKVIEKVKIKKYDKQAF